MADYRLPMDADGVKYHGVVDRDGENPGQVLYGVDENGDYRPVNVDKDGNVLTKVTGSVVEKEIILERKIRNERVSKNDIKVPDNALGCIFYLVIHGSTGMFESDQGISLSVGNRSVVDTHYILYTETEVLTDPRPHVIYWFHSISLKDAKV